MTRAVEGAPSVVAIATSSAPPVVPPKAASRKQVGHGARGSHGDGCPRGGGSCGFVSSHRVPNDPHNMIILMGAKS